MAPRIRPRPKGKPKLNVTTTSSKEELKRALDQARAAKVEADKSGTPQQKRRTHAKYIRLLQMQPQVIPTGQGGDSIRNLSIKERVETGNLKPIRNNPIPPGERLRREQVSDAGKQPISDYIKEKYPKKKGVKKKSVEERLKDRGYDLDDLDASNPFNGKKKGGKITYKMTGGQVVDISYD